MPVNNKLPVVACSHRYRGLQHGTSLSIDARRRLPDKRASSALEDL